MSNSWCSGFEISFIIPSSDCYIELRILLYTGSTYYLYGIQYDRANTRLSYYGSGGAFVVFQTGISLYEHTYLLHTAKLIVDLVSAKYHRFILDDKQYDLSVYSPYSAASVTGAHLQNIFYFQTRVAANIISYADDAIATQNES